MRSFYKVLVILITIGLTDCSGQDENRFVDINGKQQYIRVKGTGKPPIVFVTGLGEQLTNFDSIQNVMSRATMTFSFDRAGLGKSEAISVERSIDNMAEELELLLLKSNIKSPYVLVGHSLGSMIIRYYNYLYPDKVTGLILIDPASEKYDDEIRKGLDPKEIKKIDSLDYALVPWTRDERVPISIRSEYQNFRTSGKELVKNTKFPTDKPVTVISSSRYSDIEKKEQLSQREVDIWVRLHNDWRKEAPQMRHIITEKSGHYIHNEEPELIIKEIALMLDKLKK